MASSQNTWINIPRLLFLQTSAALKEPPHLFLISLLRLGAVLTTSSEGWHLQQQWTQLHNTAEAIRLYPPVLLLGVKLVQYNKLAAASFFLLLLYLPWGWNHHKQRPKTGLKGDSPSVWFIQSSEDPAVWHRIRDRERLSVCVCTYKDAFDSLLPFISTSMVCGENVLSGWLIQRWEWEIWQYTAIRGHRD